MQKDSGRDHNPHRLVNLIRHDHRIQSGNDLKDNEKKQDRIKNFQRLNSAHGVTREKNFSVENYNAIPIFPINPHARPTT
jgi:hypothetical protein